jgi:uncharacterized protein (DUF362 family)
VGIKSTRVVLCAIDRYEEGITDRLVDGLSHFPNVLQRVSNGTVVLKPNLVEFHPDRPINTNPVLVACAVEAFYRLGAKEVVVGEGPGHIRDTGFLLEATGLGEYLRQLDCSFVDLNADAAKRVRLPHNLTGLKNLEIASTVAHADLLVSMPKMKVHHWAGVTLSMKNLFGVLPGHVYGWPKNPLHWAGINNTIIDLFSIFQSAFAIVDGIVGMEGDGPIMGQPVQSGVVIMGDLLSAVDAEATRLMGIDPLSIHYLKAVRGSLASEQIGDAVESIQFNNIWAGSLL